MKIAKENAVRFMESVKITAVWFFAKNLEKLLIPFIVLVYNEST